MIKQEFFERLEEIEELNENLNKRELKKLLKNETNEIITSINNSKKYKSNEIIELITNSMEWLDEFLKRDKIEEIKNKYKKENNQKEIEQNLNIITIAYITFIITIILLYIVK